MLKLKHIPYYYQLMRLDKPIGSLLLLWPTLWALWIVSEGVPPLNLLFIFTLGVFLMRSAGCVINDYADRHIDKQVERTKDRPLTSGKISEKEALLLFAILCICAFICVLFLNTYTIYLSLIALILAVLYPFMKRFTYYPQLFLGMAFSWAIPMAFAAKTDSIPNIAWVLYVLTLLWIVAYDTQYAMVDKEDDLNIGVKSTAIAFANHDKLIILILQLTSLSGLVWVGFELNYGLSYYMGLVAALGLVVYQQWLIKDRKKSLCFKAFLNNNWFGISVFVGIVVNYL